MIDKKFFESLDPKLKLNKEICMQGQCSQASVAVRETKYNQEIAILHNTIDSLANELATLRNRLEPFMILPMPTVGESNCEKECLPSAINQINEATQKIIEIKNFVNETLQRLEL